MAVVPDNSLEACSLHLHHYGLSQSLVSAERNEKFMKMANLNLDDKAGARWLADRVSLLMTLQSVEEATWAVALESCTRKMTSERVTRHSLKIE